MMSWLESIYSDGSAAFAEPQSPKAGDHQKLRMVVCETAPIDHVYLRYIRNGCHEITEAHPIRVDKQSAWAKGHMAMYEAEFIVTELPIHYQFLIVSEGRLYYYSQRGVTSYLQEQIYDFTILENYVEPSWVKESVFYQIFPERFCNGDSSLDVVDGEFEVNGFPAIHVKDWNTPAADYQKTHCMDFYGGDLIGIREKIPYLKELGVTAVYLNPIFTAPSVHKYDCIDYEEIDPHLGGDQALAELSRALHENGMRLIMDISINHTGIAHKWFNRDNLYYDSSVGAYQNPDSPERKYYYIDENNHYASWYGVDTMPVLDYRSESLRDKIYRAENSILKKWLKPPYSIDGWRFDVADELCKNDDVQLDREVWPQIRESIRSVNPQAYILAESWSENVCYFQGDCWDASMNYFGFIRILRQFLGLPDPHYWNHPVLSQIHAPISAEEAAKRMMDYLARMPFVFWRNQYNLLNSHDMTRIQHYDICEGDYHAMVIMLFTMIGVPSLFYGDEAAIDGHRIGFEGARYPMPWSEHMKESSIWQLYHDLIALRRSTPALQEGGFKIIYAKDQTLVFARMHSAGHVVSAIHLGDEAIRIPLPEWLGLQQELCMEAHSGQILLA